METLASFQILIVNQRKFTSNFVHFVISNLTHNETVQLVHFGFRKLNIQSYVEAKR